MAPDLIYVAKSLKRHSSCSLYKNDEIVTPYLLVFECNVRSGSFDTDLTNSATFSNVCLRDSEQSCYLLDDLFIFPCELTRLALRVTELEVANPQYSREHTEYPKRERLRYIQNL